MKKRIMSFILAFVILLTSIDVTVFATDVKDEENTETIETVEVYFTEEIETEVVETEVVDLELFESVTTENNESTINEVTEEIEIQDVTNLTSESSTSGTCGDNLTWTLTDDGVLTISGTGDMYDYTNENSPPWPIYESKTVIFEEGITSIGTNAFLGISIKNELVFPSTLKVIGDFAFCWSEISGDIVIPESVTTIGEGVFDDCLNLSGIAYIPESVTNIHKYAFGSSPITVIYGKSGSEIENYIQKYASWITFVPTDSDEDSVFSGTCGDNLTWEWVDNVLTISGTGDMYDYDQYTSPWSNLAGTVILEEGITSIGTYAFDYCNFDIEEIPSTVTKIGDNAFSFSGISGDIIIPESVITIGNEAFWGCQNITIHGVIGSVAETYAAENDIEFVDINAPKAIVSGSCGLNIMTGEPYDNVRWSVMEDGRLEITGSGNMYNYDNPGEVPWRDYSEQITAIDFTKSNLSTIGMYSFSYLENVTEIVIPEEVSYVNPCAFLGCGNLKKATINGNLGDDVFDYCTSLETLIIGDKTTRIGQSCFSWDVSTPIGKKLEACPISHPLTFPEGLKSIGPFAFQGCKYIYGDLIFPESLESLGTSAFGHCTGLDGKVEFNSNITAEYYGVDPDSVGNQIVTVYYESTIPNNCFYNTGIKEVVLHDDINDFLGAAFDYCSDLTIFSAVYGTTAWDLAVEMADRFPCDDYGFKIGEASVEDPRDPFTITFDTAGGSSEIESQSIKAGKYITCPEVPTHPEYIFNNWYLLLEDGETISDEPFDFSSPVTGNMTLVAKWIVPVNVTFDATNGTEVVTIKVVPDTCATKPEDPVYTGYYFLGWYLDDTVYDFDTAVTEDITLAAKWHFMETVATPVSSIPSGSEFYRGTEISLTSETPGALIYYTIDGSEPTVETGILYRGPFTIDTSVTIKAIAVKDEMWHNSAVTEIVYTVPETGDVLIEDIPVGGVDAIPEGLWIAGVAESYTYEGKAIKPAFRVYDHMTLLVEKKDYTVAYKNNTKVNDGTVVKTAPTITITGKGNYAGKVTATFAITPKSIEDADIVINEILLKYNGKTQKKVPTLKWGKITLKNKTDYTVDFVDTINEDGTKNADAYKMPGPYTIIVTGKGNYTGTCYVTMTITDATLMSKVSVAKIKNQVYTGAEIKPELTVKNGKKVLEEGFDYWVYYEDNVEIGTATAVVVGMNNYVGEKRVTFKITGIALSGAKVTGIPKSMVYTGNAITVDDFESDVVVTKVINKETVTLTENVDYVISYSKNVNKGTATIVFTGIGKYTGTLKKTFAIKAYSFATLDGKVTVSIDDSYKYAKGGVKPEPVVMFGNVMLTKGKDYTVSYKNNAKVNDGSNSKTAPRVTVTGKGNYAGSMTVYFAIEKQEFSLLNITATDKTYAKKVNAYKSTPVIKDFDSKTLKAGTDYEKAIVYTYKYDTVVRNGKVDVARAAGELVNKNDIVPAGTVIVVTVTGKGNYTNSTLSTEYRVTKAAISKATVTVPKQTYTGKAITPGTDEIVVKMGKTVLTTDDYEIVGYSNNVKKGTATITIKGKGNYGGTKTQKFTIQAKKFVWYWDVVTMTFRMREVE